MSDTQTPASALLSLAKSSTGRTKMGRFRQLLPEIEAARQAGATHQAIVDVLRSQGLELSEKTYSVMLARARAKTKQQAPASPRQEHRPVSVMRQPAPGQSVELSDQRQSTPGKPETFDWEALKRQEIAW